MATQLAPVIWLVTDMLALATVQITASDVEVMSAVVLVTDRVVRVTLHVINKKLSRNVFAMLRVIFLVAPVTIRAIYILSVLVTILAMSRQAVRAITPATDIPRALVMLHVMRILAVPATIPVMGILVVPATIHVICTITQLQWLCG